MARYEGKRGSSLAARAGWAWPRPGCYVTKKGVTVLTGRTEVGVETARRQLGDGVNVVASDATSLVTSRPSASTSRNA